MNYKLIQMQVSISQKKLSEEKCLYLTIENIKKFTRQMLSNEQNNSPMYDSIIILRIPLYL